MSWAEIGLALLNLMVMGVFVPLLRSVARLRSNELKHLQDSVDEVKGLIQTHLQWHMDHP